VISHAVVDVGGMVIGGVVSPLRSIDHRVFSGAVPGS
jgi:hypothetical protein